MTFIQLTVPKGITRYAGWVGLRLYGDLHCGPCPLLRYLRSQVLVSVHIEFTSCNRHTCLAGQYVYIFARRVLLPLPRGSTCDRFTYFAHL